MERRQINTSSTLAKPDSQFIVARDLSRRALERSSVQTQRSIGVCRVQRTALTARERVRRCDEVLLDDGRVDNLRSLVNAFPKVSDARRQPLKNTRVTNFKMRYCSAAKAATTVNAIAASWTKLRSPLTLSSRFPAAHLPALSKIRIATLTIE